MIWLLQLRTSSCNDRPDLRYGSPPPTPNARRLPHRTRAQQGAPFPGMGLLGRETGAGARLRADAASAWMEFVRCCAGEVDGVVVEFELRGGELTVVVLTEGAAGVTQAGFELLEWLEQRR